MNCRAGSCFRVKPAGIAALSGCIAPSIFSECFTGYAGSVPANGWTTVSLPPGTSASFNGSLMVMATPGGAPPGLAPDVAKAVTGTIPFPYRDTSFQAKFIQFGGSMANADTLFEFRLHSNTPASATRISLAGTASPGVGVVTIDVSNGGTVSRRTGAWVPAMGAPTEIHLTVASDGTPLFYIDEVPIPLGGPSSVGVAPTLTGSVEVRFRKSGPGDSGAVDYIFVNAGVQPPTAIYCCPEGGPPS